MLKLYRRCIVSSKWVEIRGHIIRIVLVGARVAQGSKTIVFRVGTLHTILISIRVWVVGPFMMHFSLLIDVDLLL